LSRHRCYVNISYLDKYSKYYVVEGKLSCYTEFILLFYFNGFEVPLFK
jgi:hypothetical protein